MNLLRGLFSLLAVQVILPAIKRTHQSLKNTFCCGHQLQFSPSGAVGVLACGHLFSSLVANEGKSAAVVFALSSAGRLIVLLVSCGLHRGQLASPVSFTLLLLLLTHRQSLTK